MIETTHCWLYFSDLWGHLPKWKRVGDNSRKITLRLNRGCNPSTVHGKVCAMSSLRFLYRCSNKILWTLKTIKFFSDRWKTLQLLRNQIESFWFCKYWARYVYQSPEFLNIIWRIDPLLGNGSVNSTAATNTQQYKTFVARQYIGYIKRRQW
jgi:hypothetical protein